MSKFFNCKQEAGLEDVNEPRLGGWNRNTALCCDLKTLLRSDRNMRTGKEYPGILRRDIICEDFHYDEHYTFIETQPQVCGKRSPRVYDGELITVTRWDDGSYHPNFKSLKVGAGFSVDSYAIRVCNELRQALKGLVEEG